MKNEKVKDMLESISAGIVYILIPGSIIIILYTLLLISVWK